MRSNQLSYPAIMFQNFVEIEGLEPSLTEPESVVLPLHHISIWLPIFDLGLQRYECFVKMQNFFQKNDGCPLSEQYFSHVLCRYRCQQMHKTAESVTMLHLSRDVLNCCVIDCGKYVTTVAEIEKIKHFSHRCVLDRRKYVTPIGESYRRRWQFFDGCHKVNGTISYSLSI